MSRKSLGIVSSYNTMCGNATYTHVLKEEFAHYCEVRIIPVNHRLLANQHPMAAKAIEEHIQDICRAISSCDYVNIQFEPGLYGARPKQIASNICRMIDSAKRLVFTVHRLHMPPESPLHIALFKGLLSGPRGALATMRDWRYRNGNYGMMKRIVASLATKAVTAPQNVTVIAHTQRDCDNLKLFYGLDCAIDFPVTFLNSNQISSHVSQRERIRAEVMEQYCLNPAHKHIGVFGFLSENKGHHVAVDALRYLPSDYRLAIFGGQHPMSLKEYNLSAMLDKPKLFSSNNNAYIATLIDAARRLLVNDSEHVPDDTDCSSEQEWNAPRPTEHRVRFLGSVNDPDFIRAIIAMDYVFVPYFETGQGGSGNASLILELQSKVVFSRNIAFLELARYFPACYKFSDIGNAPEMAQAIFFWKDDFTANQVRAAAVYNIENNIKLHLAAFEGGIEAARSCKQQLVQAERSQAAAA